MNASPSRTVIVTGAASGIGRATAVRVAGCGMTVIAAARRVTELDTLVATIEGSDGTAVGVVTDVARPADIEHLVEQAAAAGRIDALVNVAGVGHVHSVMADDADLLQGRRGQPARPDPAHARRRADHAGAGQRRDSQHRLDRRRDRRPRALLGDELRVARHVRLRAPRAGRYRHHGDADRAGLHRDRADRQPPRPNAGSPTSSPTRSRIVYRHRHSLRLRCGRGPHVLG